MVVLEPKFVCECAKHFASKKKKQNFKVLIESCSKFTFGHQWEGFQSVRYSRMCQSTKDNSWQLEQEKTWSHKVFIWQLETHQRGCSGAEYKNPWSHKHHQVQGASEKSLGLF